MSEIKLYTVPAATAGGPLFWNGGRGSFMVHGTFNSATLTLEWSLDATTWTAAGTDTTKTANGSGVFVLGRCYLRVNNSGSGVDVKASISGA